MATQTNTPNNNNDKSSRSQAGGNKRGEESSKTTEALSSVREIGQELESRFTDLRDRATEYQSMAVSYVRENPIKAVAAAMGIGVLVGVVARRSIFRFAAVLAAQQVAQSFLQDSQLGERLGLTTGSRSGSRSQS